MLSLEHHLAKLKGRLTTIEEALASPAGSLPRGNAAELASDLVREAGAVAGLFVHRAVSPHTVPTGHSGPFPRSDKLEA